jgi:hypothetical protein
MRRLRGWRQVLNTDLCFVPGPANQARYACQGYVAAGYHLDCAEIVASGTLLADGSSPAYVAQQSASSLTTASFTPVSNFNSAGDHLTPRHSAEPFLSFRNNVRYDKSIAKD